MMMIVYNQKKKKKIIIIIKCTSSRELAGERKAVNVFYTGQITKGGERYTPPPSGSDLRVNIYQYDRAFRLEIYSFE